MTDKLDTILDWLDGLLPSFVLFSNELFFDLKKEKTIIGRIIKLTILVIKALFAISSIYKLYYIKVVQKQYFFKVDINTKITTTIISLVLLIIPIIKSANSVKMIIEKK